jgi:hypothetical protein
MKLKIKSAEEFRHLLTALLDDIVDARLYFTLHQNLAKAVEEYTTEFNQSPTFWGLTFHAHIDAVMLRLCRIYDTYERSVLNLRNLLETVQAHLSIFEKPYFRERLKKNPFVESLAAELKPPDEAQLRKDIEMVTHSDPLVRKVVMWRNNYVAHRNSHYVLNPKKFDTHPLPFGEIDVLLKRALQIGNRYSKLFDASAHATLMIGRHDYKYVLQAVREHVDACKRRLEDECKRIGIANSEG